MFLLRLCLFVCVNLFLYARCSIPVEKLCVNPACKEPISKARGSVKYIPHARELLGFNRGQEIIITSKSKNANDYWGAIINGKSGYVPSHLVKEVKMFHKVDDLIPVPVKETQKNSSAKGAKPLENNTLDQISSNKDEANKTNLPHLSESVVTAPNLENSDGIKKPIDPNETFKVIEGTTIYSDEPDEIITPSATVNVKSPQTVTPVSNNINKEVTQERATIPPEIISLNSDYEKQNLESNFSLESVKKNDENVEIESKDIDAEEDEGEDVGEEDEEGEGDDEGDEEEDDEDEENSNSFTKGELDKEKESSTTIVKELNKSSENDKREEMIASSTQSVLAEVGERASENVINVIDNAKTNQVSADIGHGQAALPVEKEPRVLPPPLTPQNLNNDQLKGPTQGPPSSWSMLNGFKENSPSSGGSPNVPSEPSRSFDDKYENPQTVISEFVKVPTSARTPEMVSPVKSEDLAETAIETNSESLSETTSQAIEKMTDTASVATPQVPSAASNHIPDTTTPEVIKEITTEDAVNSLGPSVQQTSILFNQFSVSADSVSEKIENVERPSITTEIIQEKVEVTSETFVTPPRLAPTESPQEFPASQVTSIPDAITSEIIQENIEVTTKSSISLSVFPEVYTEESLQEGTSKVIDDTKISEELSEDFGITSEKRPEEKEPGLLDQILDTFSNLFSSTSKEELIPSEKENSYEAPAQDILKNQKAEAKNSEDIKGEPSGACRHSTVGGICEDFAAAEEQSSFLNSWIPVSFGFDSIITQSNTFLYLVVTAVTVLLFTLGHNFIEKRGKTGPLIAKNNKLEHELLVTSKECLMLKDEVQSLKEKIILYENSANDELVISLQAELEESKKIKSELESSIEVLQQELDAATEAGLDLNKMLSEVLTQKGGSESLLKSVESLQAQLDSQQKVIDEMTKKLGVKNQENEVLQAALEVANEKSENLEEELSDIKHNLNLHLKEKEDLTQDLNSQIHELNTRINQLGETKEKETFNLKEELGELQKKLSETLSALTVKEEEVKALKESMKHLKAKGDVEIETVFDVSRVKAELAKEVKENRALVERLQEVETGKNALFEQFKALTGEVQKLRKSYEEAEQKKDEAEKKLEVLSTYFKEKETQLQKELGLQEALWAQKKGDEKAVYNMMKSLQEEVESYKSQNETLKKEILDQERGLKNQIASLEQKAYENWVAARQAERKLEESKQEMGQLRNRLTLIEKNSNNVEGKGNLRPSEELNGVEAVSPILHDTSSPLLFPPFPLDPNNSNMLPPHFMPPPMFMPPPIGSFIPPPPFLPGDRRPPPLGRMSSPPLNNRFSPSSPADYPFERMSSPPLSLPGSNYRSPNEDREHFRHRTPPYPPLHPRNWDDGNEMPGFIPISSQRDSRRDHKGSNVSSEHSSSESLDKSSRHSARV